MTRIDVALVGKNLIETRNKAKDAILNHKVFCNGKLVLKCSMDVKEGDLLFIQDTEKSYVSKGGLKLEKAISHFSLSLKGKTMVDIGSSTGGFSDCAIQNGIDHIIAIDVGKEQFSPKLLKTGKVSLYEQTDFRNMDFSLLKEVSFATIDVSFISVIKLLDSLKRVPKLQEIVLLIKPQFECGKTVADRFKGIVLDEKVHIHVIEKVTSAFEEKEFYLQNLTFSPIRGGSGNIEYLAYFTKDENKDFNDPVSVVKEAFHFFHISRSKN